LQPTRKKSSHAGRKKLLRLPGGGKRGSLQGETRTCKIHPYLIFKRKEKGEIVPLRADHAEEKNSKREAVILPVAKRRICIIRLSVKEKPARGEETVTLFPTCRICEKKGACRPLEGKIGEIVGAGSPANRRKRNDALQMYIGYTGGGIAGPSRRKTWSFPGWEKHPEK